MTKKKTPPIPEIPATQLNKTMGQILDRVYRGETILLTRYGRPYVLMSPPPAPAEDVQAG
jgi:antitoxin (DNA-binding transcriptional repressor) of toxin-antitoxin stability system